MEINQVHTCALAIIKHISIYLSKLCWFQRVCTESALLRIFKFVKKPNKVSQNLVVQLVSPKDSSANTTQTCRDTQYRFHCAKKPVTTMLTYPWKCTVLHCNHLGNTWKPLVLMTWHFDYCPSASKGDNQSVRSSAPVVSRSFPGGYNVKLYISRGRLAWWLLAFLHSEIWAGKRGRLWPFHVFSLSQRIWP